MKVSFMPLIAATVLSSLAFAEINPRVIYGEDDRLDVYQVDSQAVRMLADSTAAMIPLSKLKKDTSGMVKIDVSSYSEEYGLCQDEPFYSQPNAAYCSGFLVGEDLLATAGHCVQNTSDCNSMAFVFGFKMLDENTAVTSVPEDHVYKCTKIVKHAYTRQADFALIRLDKKVVGRDPVKVRREGRPKAGDSLFVIGHPAGLPTKVAGGAQLRSWFKDGSYFIANLDTYGGNSGSAVFNTSTHEVEGILVRGATDYVYDSEKKCRRSNVCTNEGCSGEDVSSISLLTDKIPAL